MILSTPRLPFRCVRCGAEFPAPEEPDRGCVRCGLRADLLDATHDLNLPVNWQEVRILAQWARNWLDQRGYPTDTEPAQILQAILVRLREHRPPGAAPLLLQDEVANRRAAGAPVHLYDRGEALLLVITGTASRHA